MSFTASDRWIAYSGGSRRSLPLGLEEWHPGPPVAPSPLPLPSLARRLWPRQIHGPGNRYSDGWSIGPSNLGGLRLMAKRPMATATGMAPGNSLKMHPRRGKQRSVGRGRAASRGVPRPEVLARDTFGFPADVAGVHSTLHPRKGVTMSELRNRMIQDLKLAGLVEGTSEAYLRAVRQLAAYYMIPPDSLPNGRSRTTSSMCETTWALPRVPSRRCLLTASSSSTSIRSATSGRCSLKKSSQATPETVARRPQ